MTQRSWIILGATSIIAEQFAHNVAHDGQHVYLVGRQPEQLHLIAQDIKLRYQASCTVISADMTQALDELLQLLNESQHEFDLFLAHSDFTDNAHLNPQSIQQLVRTNIEATCILINAYWHKKQEAHHLLFISSVAACRGRSKNSLYGASKACIEVYLQGLQQIATSNQHITIARLGFIDTKQTFGLPGVFYAAAPKHCARACWNALKKRKRMIYYPFFWRQIMALICRLPFFIYKKMGAL